MPANGFDSGFDAIEQKMAELHEVNDAAKIAALKATVDKMLAERSREEVGGDTFAYDRIAGSVRDLRILKAQALQVGAAPAYVEIVDTVIAAAEAARTVAAARPEPTTDKAARRAPWTKASLKDFDSLPDFLRGI